MQMAGYVTNDDGSVRSMGLEVTGQISREEEQTATGNFQLNVDEPNNATKTMVGKFVLLSSNQLKAKEAKSKAEPLAPMADVPEGLHKLNLSQTQADQLNKWQKSKDANPDHLSLFLSTILRADQRNTWAKIESPQSGDPNKK